METTKILVYYNQRVDLPSYLSLVDRPTWSMAVGDVKGKHLQHPTTHWAGWASFMKGKTSTLWHIANAPLIDATCGCNAGTKKRLCASAVCTFRLISTELFVASDQTLGSTTQRQRHDVRSEASVSHKTKLN